MKNLLLPFVCCLAWVSLNAQSLNVARQGMVTSDHWLASVIGVDILREGGNAVDAAVATAFALAVVDPDAGNIGGGGFLVYRGSDGFSTAIDFREKAPLEARPDMYLDSLGERVDTERISRIQGAGVPGTVAGLYLAHQKYGKLEWHRLVQPAIGLARNGFRLPYILAEQARTFQQGKDATDFMKDFFRDESGKLLEFGDSWRQPALAQTLEHIRDKGHDGFYKGPVATEIDRYMKSHGGLVTKKDLRQYEAIERPPLIGKFKDFEIISMPPPSSGGVVLIEMLNMFELAARDSLEFNSAAYYHMLAEIMRRAYADRAEYLGDPDFNPDMPTALLTSKAHALKRFHTIRQDRASISDSTRFAVAYESDQTTHFSVVDRDRNAVSLTFTLEQSYGSKMGSKKLGFLFNNQMRDFNRKPGYSDSGWLIGTPPNTIQPGKRMLSSMTPTIVTRDGELRLVIGSPGGRTIINTVFQTILAHTEYGLPVDKAIEAPKIHHQWFPDILFYEPEKVSPDSLEKLQGLGHRLQGRNLGVLMGIQWIPERGVLLGHADSASWDGAAAGY